MTKRTRLAWIVTTSWFVLWGVLLFTDLEEAKKLTFNEWGDFFAGIFAPLAFLWLVVGYFQQSDELSQNTETLKQQEKALILQVKELNQSVEQQKELVAITREEVELSKSNLKRQEENERRRAQPDFRFGIGSSSGIGNIIMQSGTVTNHGGSVSDISIETDPQLELTLGNTKNIDFGKQTTVKLTIPKHLPPDYNSELVIRYTDGLGNHESKLYKLSKNPSGLIVIDPKQVG